MSAIPVPVTTDACAEQAKLWLTRTKEKLEEANRLAEEAEQKVNYPHAYEYNRDKRAAASRATDAGQHLQGYALTLQLFPFGGAMGCSANFGTCLHFSMYTLQQRATDA